jgi:hypothetical protein
MQWAIFDPSVPAGLQQPQPLPVAPTGLLSIIYLDNTAETFIGVPQTVATAWQTTPSKATFFNAQIKPVYHELLLISGSNCPLLTTGTQALWTK